MPPLGADCCRLRVRQAEHLLSDPSEKDALPRMQACRLWLNQKAFSLCVVGELSSDCSRVIDNPISSALLFVCRFCAGRCCDTSGTKMCTFVFGSFCD